MADPTAQTGIYTGNTAEDKINEGPRDVLQEDRHDRAEAAGVTHVAYIGYAQALVNYESRSDVEPLSQRRAREIAADFSDTNFVRAGSTPEVA